MKDGTPPVYLEHQRLSAPAQQVRVSVPVHHQKLHGCQASAAEELGGRAVEQNLAAVADQAQARGYRDAQGGGVLRVLQGQRVRADGVFEMAACNGHPPQVHIQRVSHLFLQRGQLAAAARQEYGGGRRPVKGKHPLGDFPGQQFNRGGKGGFHLVHSAALLQPQNIGKLKGAAS